MALYFLGILAECLYYLDVDAFASWDHHLYFPDRLYSEGGGGREFLMNSLTSSQLIALTRLFSAAVVRELAWKSRSSLFHRLLKESQFGHLISAGSVVRNVFDIAFDLPKIGNYRSEYVYKAALTEKLLLGRHSLRTAVMLPEFRVGACKADIAILNGTSTVYEIKSERDRLDRLAPQLAAYLQVFAAVNVITGNKHLKEITSTIPTDVGILVLNDRFQISVVRSAQEDSSRIKPPAVFASLQSCEARAILDLTGAKIPSVPNTQIRRVLLEQFVCLTPEQVHAGMVKVLRETRTHLPLKNLIDKLPPSIRAAAIGASLRREGLERLLRALDTSFSEALTWG